MEQNKEIPLQKHTGVYLKKRVLDCGIICLLKGQLILSV